MGLKMHAAGRNNDKNEIGGQNDDACGKIAKIQTAPPMTRACKYSTLNEESFGRSIFGLLSEPHAKGERSGSLFTPHREGA
jgi:hypothetical protein